MQEKKKSICYNTPNGTIFSIDIFKGKKALVGDYFPFSYANTKIVLTSLGMSVTIEETMAGVKNRILKGEQYDVIFTNNIYRGGTGLQLLKELQHFLNLGFDGCLKKPIKQEEVIQNLKNLF